MWTALTGCLATRYFCYNQAGCDRYSHSFSVINKVEPAFEQLLISLASKDEFMHVAGLLSDYVWQKRASAWGIERIHLERQITAAQENISGLIRRLPHVSNMVTDEIEKEVAVFKDQVHTLERQLARYQEEIMQQYFCKSAAHPFGSGI